MFAGSLRWALKDAGKLSMVLGAYLVGVGLLALFTGFYTPVKLKSLKAALLDRDHVRKKFKLYAGRDGCLDLKELSELCKHLGKELSPAELEAAYEWLDRDSNGAIEADEFVKWWEGHDAFYSDL